MVSWPCSSAWSAWLDALCQWTRPCDFPSLPPTHGLSSAKVSRAAASIVQDSVVRLIQRRPLAVLSPHLQPMALFVGSAVTWPLPLCAPRCPLPSLQALALRAQLPGLMGSGDTSSSEVSLCSLDVGLQCPHSCLLITLKLQRCFVGEEGKGRGTSLYCEVLVTLRSGLLSAFSQRGNHFSRWWVTVIYANSLQGRNGCDGSHCVDGTRNSRLLEFQRAVQVHIEKGGFTSPVQVT